MRGKKNNDDNKSNLSYITHKFISRRLRGWERWGDRPRRLNPSLMINHYQRMYIRY